MKRTLGAGEWLRRGLGVAVILATTAISLGADIRFLSQASYASTAVLEQGLLDHLIDPAADEKMQQAPVTTMTDAAAIRIKAQKVAPALLVEPTVPGLDGAVQWLNSAPLTLEQLKGKGVLVDFWTFGCINCLHALPHVQEWAAKYADQGLVVIGVHSPEFAYEKDPANVMKAVTDLGITFPVALDNDYAIWRQFANHYWPAHYFIDAEGRVRFHHFGEGVVPNIKCNG